MSAMAFFRRKAGFRKEMCWGHLSCILPRRRPTSQRMRNRVTTDWTDSCHWQRLQPQQPPPRGSVCQYAANTWASSAEPSLSVRPFTPVTQRPLDDRSALTECSVYTARSPKIGTTRRHWQFVCASEHWFMSQSVVFLAGDTANIHHSTSNQHDRFDTRPHATPTFHARHRLLPPTNSRLLHRQLNPYDTDLYVGWVSAVSINSLVTAENHATFCLIRNVLMRKNIKIYANHVKQLKEKWRWQWLDREMDRVGQTNRPKLCRYESGAI